MHSSTLFLVALASIMVSFTSAKNLNKENSVTGINQVFDNQGAHGNFHQKRRMRKRLSPGNSGSTRAGAADTYHHSSASPASVGGGLPIDSLTGSLLGGAGGSGGLPLVDGLL